MSNALQSGKNGSSGRGPDGRFLPEIAGVETGIRAITRHESDIIVRADRPGEIHDRLSEAKGTARLVKPPDGKGETLV